MTAIDSFFVFPPPQRTINKRILALIVEKKGDESRTSMKQNEIFCFSPLVRMRDGVMILPKIHWHSYEPGDWITCQPVYAFDRSGNCVDERELTDLRKVSPDDYGICDIPPTSTVNGFVRIECQFTLCPTFIKNRQTQNGKYKKLYLLNIGQGFVRVNNIAFDNLSQRRNYIGVFEFHSEDNGAVNFTHPSEKELIDRSAMWELVEVKKTSVSQEEINKMNNALVNLRREAMEYEREMRQKKVQNQSKKTPPNPSFVEKPASKPESSATSFPPSEEVEELNALMDRVIIRGMFTDNDGNMVQKWIDTETKEITENDDLLRFKLFARYGIVDDPSTLSLSTPVMNTTLPPTDAAPTTSNQVSPSEVVPLVLPSPRPRPPPPAAAVEQKENMGDSTFLELIRSDNNANPVFGNHETSLRR